MHILPYISMQHSLLKMSATSFTTNILVGSISSLQRDLLGEDQLPHVAGTILGCKPFF